MAGVANKTVVLANGYDLSSFLTTAQKQQMADALEATTFGKTAHTYKAGLKDATLSLDGLYDQRADTGHGGTADAIDDVLAAAIGLSPQSVITVVKLGDGFGQIGYAMEADETKYEIQVKAQDLTKVATTFQSSNGADRIVVLHQLQQETTTGNGTDHDDGATGTPSTNGLGAYLHVTAITGGTLTAKVQHSTDGVTWVDLATFTAVTTSHASQYVEIPVGTTINRHLRATWTLSAGAATFHVAAGRR